eukprot:359943-Chlamydomonas_euryale.AAC.1
MTLDSCASIVGAEVMSFERYGGRGRSEDAQPPSTAATRRQPPPAIAARVWRVTRRLVRPALSGSLLSTGEKCDEAGGGGGPLVWRAARRLVRPAFFSRLPCTKDQRTRLERKGFPCSTCQEHGMLKASQKERAVVWWTSMLRACCGRACCGLVVDEHAADLWWTGMLRACELLVEPQGGQPAAAHPRHFAAERALISQLLSIPSYPCC